MTRECDLGPQQPEGIGKYPASQGAEIYCMVSILDADGNERAGVR